MYRGKQEQERLLNDAKRLTRVLRARKVKSIADRLPMLDENGCLQFISQEPTSEDLEYYQNCDGNDTEIDDFKSETGENEDLQLHKLIDLSIKKPQADQSDVPDELNIKSQRKQTEAKEEPVEAEEIKADADNQEGEGSQKEKAREVEYS